MKILGILVVFVVNNIVDLFISLYNRLMFVYVCKRQLYVQSNYFNYAGLKLKHCVYPCFVLPWLITFRNMSIFTWVIRTHTHTHTYVCECVCIRIYICVSLYVCVCVCIYIYIYIIYILAAQLNVAFYLFVSLCVRSTQWIP